MVKQRAIRGGASVAWQTCSNDGKGMYMSESLGQIRLRKQAWRFSQTRYVAAIQLSLVGERQ